MSNTPKKLIIPRSAGEIALPPGVEDKPSLPPGPCSTCHDTRAELAHIGQLIARLARANQILLVDMMAIANLDLKTGQPLSDDETPEMLRARESLLKVQQTDPASEMPGMPSAG